jgi:hypothetical protein
MFTPDSWMRWFNSIGPEDKSKMAKFHKDAGKALDEIGEHTAFSDEANDHRQVTRTISAVDEVFDYAKEIYEEMSELLTEAEEECNELAEITDSLLGILRAVAFDDTHDQQEIIEWCRDNLRSEWECYFYSKRAPKTRSIYKEPAKRYLIVVATDDVDRLMIKMRWS